MDQTPSKSAAEWLREHEAHIAWMEDAHHRSLHTRDTTFGLLFLVMCCTALNIYLLLTSDIYFVRIIASMGMVTTAIALYFAIAGLMAWYRLDVIFKEDKKNTHEYLMRLAEYQLEEEVAHASSQLPD